MLVLFSKRMNFVQPADGYLIRDSFWCSQLGGKKNILKCKLDILNPVE